MEGQRAHATVGIVQEGQHRVRPLRVGDGIHGLERARANLRIRVPEQPHHFRADRSRRGHPQHVERVVDLLRRRRRLEGVGDDLTHRLGVEILLNRDL